MKLIGMVDFVLEQYEEVPSLGGSYLINQEGQLYSKPRTGANGRFLKIQKGKEYLFYRVSVNGKSLNVYLHRLLGECFIPNPYNKPQINHKDGNKHNNNISNLDWCTNKENIRHSIDIGLKDLSFNKGENNSRAILNNESVLSIKERLKNKDKSRDIANDFNVSEQLICDIKKSRKWADIN